MLPGLIVQRSSAQGYIGPILGVCRANVERKEALMRPREAALCNIKLPGVNYGDLWHRATILCLAFYNNNVLKQNIEAFGLYNSNVQTEH